MSRPAPDWRDGEVVSFAPTLWTVFFVLVVFAMTEIISVIGSFSTAKTCRCQNCDCLAAEGSDR